MKIKKLKKLSGSKYKIFFEDGTSITTYDDVLLNKNILYNEEVSETDLKEINKDTLYFDIYNKIIKKISTKLRSKKEVEDFLDEQELNIASKKSILKKLEDNNLINDETFAKAFINDRFNLSSDGIFKIKKELLNHNISEELINKELSKISSKDIINKLAKLITKDLKSNNKSYNKAKEKMLYKFINLGYTKEDVLEVFSGINIDNETLIKKEYSKLYSKLSKKYDGFELKMKLKEKLYQKGFDTTSINSILQDEF